MIKIKIQQFLDEVLSPTVLPDAWPEGSWLAQRGWGVCFSCWEGKKKKDIPTEVSCQVTITVPNTLTSSLSNELCKLLVAEHSLSFLPWQFSVPNCLVSRTYRFASASLADRRPVRAHLSRGAPLTRARLSFGAVTAVTPTHTTAVWHTTSLLPNSSGLRRQISHLA